MLVVFLVPRGRGGGGRAGEGGGGVPALQLQQDRSRVTRAAQLRMDGVRISLHSTRANTHGAASLTELQGLDLPSGLYEVAKPAQ